MDEALKEFGIALGKVKSAFAEEYGGNQNYIEVHINQDDYVLIVSTTSSGGYIDCHRQWVDIEEK